ncbi:MAG: ferritin-like domain-containing protein [Thermoguttaceae bacterium]
MGIFFKVQLNSLDDLLLLQLNDLYDAEKRLCDTLPDMAEAATSPELREVFRSDCEQSKRQVSRLEQIFIDLGRPSSRQTCDAMKGLIQEGSEIVSAVGNPDVKDAALIAAAQRVEHYEIAGYGSARAFAQHLGHTNVARLLQSTLEEERETDQRLTQLAEERINVQAEATSAQGGGSTR